MRTLLIGAAAFLSHLAACVAPGTAAIDDACEEKEDCAAGLCLQSQRHGKVHGVGRWLLYN
ncbi:MAG: hypothetical protein V3V08_14550 [Nannocystaceae bacterium]